VKKWWRRNRHWIVPLLIILVVLAAAAASTFVMGALIGLMGSSDCPLRLNYRLRDELIHALERMSKVEEKP